MPLMKLRLLTVFAAAFFGFMAWAVVTYPKVGEFLYRSSMFAESRVYGFSEKYLEVDGLNISYYEDEADSQPVMVLLHGFTSNKDIWLRFAKHFVDEYRVIIIDVAGHGNTPYLASLDHSAPAQAKRVFDFLAKQNIKQFHVAGNSMGGAIAALLAIEHPSSVLSMLMIDPAGFKAPSPSELDKYLAQGENPFLIDSIEEFKSFYPLTMAQPPWIPTAALDYVGSLYIERKTRWGAIFNQLDISRIFTDELADIKAPSLMMWGDKDQLLDVSSVEVWQQKMPQLQVKIWQDVGHMAMIEIPSASAKYYQEFLDKL